MTSHEQKTIRIIHQLYHTVALALISSISGHCSPSKWQLAPSLSPGLRKTLPRFLAMKDSKSGKVFIFSCNMVFFVASCWAAGTYDSHVGRWWRLCSTTCEGVPHWVISSHNHPWCVEPFLMHSHGNLIHIHMNSPFVFPCFSWCLSKQIFASPNH